jgi:hypothetical protein
MSLLVLTDGRLPLDWLWSRVGAPAEERLIGTVPALECIRSLDQVTTDLPLVVHRSLHDEKWS